MNRQAVWRGAAVDLGASSGRVLLGRFDGQHLSAEVIHRFPNEPVQALGTLHWDILRLWHEIKIGLRIASQKAREEGGFLHSIGIDTWGVDFGLLDQSGNLLGNPVHYRDRRTEGMIDEVSRQIPREELYARTGIQFQPFNTLYQLMGMKAKGDLQLQRAETLLFMPDLFHYLMTGCRVAEFTEASTSHLLNVTTRQWDWELMERLDLPRHLFLPTIEPGTKLGSLLPDVSEELGGLKAQVIAVATHDTGSAVVAVPAEREPFAYLSCGTWSLLGTERKQPILSPEACAVNLTNEGGVNHTFRSLLNISGLWLLQECRRQWQLEGRSLSWEEVSRKTLEGKPFVSLVNPDDPRFYAPPHMPGAIQSFCRDTRQPEPQTEADFLRCVTESLAMKYRHALESLERLARERYPALHMVGGGIQNEVLCQWTADAIGRPVVAGPIEATSLGNLVVQLMSAGEIADVTEARSLIARSTPLKLYEPRAEVDWDAAYERYQDSVAGSGN